MRILILFTTLSLVGCHNTRTSDKYECLTFQSKSVTDKVQSYLVSETVLQEDSIPGIVEAFSVNPEIDTLVEYVMNDNQQLRFKVGKVEFEKFINNEDSMMSCLFNNAFPYGKLIKLYSRTINIFSLGEMQVIEYEIQGGAEVFPHSILIVYSSLKTSYVGNIIISDGIKWINEGSTNGSILVFIERIRIHKQLGIPLFFTGKYFVPVTHYKLPEKWQD
jgi:hypothetical protein